MKIIYTIAEATESLAASAFTNLPGKQVEVVIEVPVPVPVAVTIAGSHHLAIYAEVGALYGGWPVKADRKIGAIKELRTRFGYEKLGLVNAKHLVEAKPADVLFHYARNHTLGNYVAPHTYAGTNWQ